MTQQLGKLAYTPPPSATLASYQNGGYQVDLYADGTKVRTEIDATTPPVLPEQMDFKLTG